jgi:simple sugar transport system permease protein
MIALVTGMLATALLAGGVLLLGALGEVIAERAGVFNLGMEGLISIGGVAGIIAVAHGAPALLGLLCAMIASAVFGCVFAASVVLLRANQTLCGLALTVSGGGLAAAVGQSYSGHPAAATFGNVCIPVLSALPVLGRAIFSQNPIVYVIWIILPIALHVLLFRTRWGIDMRAVGEDPAAADAAGVRVLRTQFAAVVAGAALAGAAGGFLTLGYITSWSDGMTGGRGWIVIALVIFGGFKPLNMVAGALLFGVITALGFVGQARDWPIPPAFLSMLPYLATIACMIVPPLLARSKRSRFLAPASLGVPYFREQR